MSRQHTPSDASSTSTLGTSTPTWLLPLLLVVGATLNLTGLLAHSLPVLVLGGSVHGILLILLGREVRGPQR